MNNTELTLDLTTLWRIFRKHLHIIIIVTVVAAGVGFVLADFVIPKKYSASALLYFENKENQQAITSISDLNAAQKLVNNAIALFREGNRIELALIDEFGFDYSIGEVKEMIGFSTVNSTEVVKVTVTMEEEALVVPVTNALVELCQEFFTETIMSGTIKVHNYAMPSSGPVYPSTKLFMAGGFAIGLLGSYLIVFIAELLDTKVKAEDDLFTIYEIPVFAEIMSFGAKVKGDYKYE